MNPTTKNKSTLVYDCRNSVSFLESAINSWGLSIEELLKNVARRINEEIKSLPPMQRPPTIDEDSAVRCENFLTLFVEWLEGPDKRKRGDRQVTSCFCDCISFTIPRNSEED